MRTFFETLLESSESVTTESRLFSGLYESLGFLVEIVDIVTICIVVYGFAYAIYLFVEMHREQWMGEKHKAVDLSVIRVKLGSYLLLALEFFIAADIILTIIDPSLDHIIQLSSIVLVRILITYFLQKEMNELNHQGVHH